MNKKKIYSFSIFQFILMSFVICKVTENKKILILGHKESGRNCFLKNYDENKFKNYIFIKTESFVHNKNSSINLFQIYSVLKKNQEFDYIFLFHSLDQENSILEENFKNLKYFFEHIQINLPHSILIFLTKRSRLVPNKEKFIKDLTISNNLNYIHIKSDCDEKLNEITTNQVLEYLKNFNGNSEDIKFEIKKKIEFIDKSIKFYNDLGTFKTLFQILEEYKDGQNSINLSDYLSLNGLIVLFLTALFIMIIDIFWRRRNRKNVKNETKILTQSDSTNLNEELKNTNLKENGKFIDAEDLNNKNEIKIVKINLSQLDDVNDKGILIYEEQYADEMTAHKQEDQIGEGWDDD